MAEELKLKGLTGFNPPPKEEQQREGKSKHTDEHTQSSVQYKKETFTNILEEVEEISSDYYESIIRAVFQMNQTEKYLISEAENLTEKLFHQIFAI